MGNLLNYCPIEHFSRKKFQHQTHPRCLCALKHSMLQPPGTKMDHSRRLWHLFGAGAPVTCSKDQISGICHVPLPLLRFSNQTQLHTKAALAKRTLLVLVLPNQVVQDHMIWSASQLLHDHCRTNRPGNLQASGSTLLDARVWRWNRFALGQPCHEQPWQKAADWHLGAENDEITFIYSW